MGRALDLQGLGEWQLEQCKLWDLFATAWVLDGTQPALNPLAMLEIKCITNGKGPIGFVHSLRDPSLPRPARDYIAAGQPLHDLNQQSYHMVKVLQGLAPAKKSCFC